MDFLKVLMMVKVAFEEKYNASKRPNDSVPVPVEKKSSITFLIMVYVVASGITPRSRTRTSLYNLLEPGMYDKRVKMKMNRGGMAIRKLNATEAALSFRPICCVCL